MKRFLAVLVFAPAVAWPAPILLDNFNEGKTENALGGATGAWYDPDDPSIFCKTDFDDVVYFGPSGKSLRLEYNIASKREGVFLPSNESVAVPVTKANQAFNGYYSVFEPKDLSHQKFLCLWVKGDSEKGFTRSLKIEIKDGLATYYAGYKVTGITDQWQKITIPLRAFTDVKDWKAIKEFVIVFSADSVSVSKGSLNVDDLSFSETPEQNFSVPFGLAQSVTAKSPIEIDGKGIRDWARASWTDLSGGEFVEQGSRSGKGDVGLKYAARWDDRWLYFLVAVRDNEVFNNESGEGLLKNDGLEIFLDPRGSDSLSGDPAVIDLVFSPTSVTGNPETWIVSQKRAPTESEVRAQWNSRRDVLELAVAWSFLDLTPGLHRDFGFSISYHDRDTQDGTPDCRLTWARAHLDKGRHRIGRMVLK